MYGRSLEAMGFDSPSPLESDQSKSLAKDKSPTEGTVEEGVEEDDNAMISNCDELRSALAIAVEKQAAQRDMKRKRGGLTGIGDLLSVLRNSSASNMTTENEKERRIVLDQFGKKVVSADTDCNRLRSWTYHPEILRSEDSETRSFQDGQRCKSRFIEKNVYERHLRDKHPIEYLVFLIQQEEEIAEQSIPLPGELSGGVPARFDGQGFLRQPKRFYKKKVSPQCPFCDKRFRNEVSLKKHFTKKHPDSVEFTQCLRCFKAIRSKDDLPTHECDLRLFNHRAKFHRGANSGFKCNMCALKFLTPRKLRKHKKMAHSRSQALLHSYTKLYQQLKLQVTEFYRGIVAYAISSAIASFEWRSIREKNTAIFARCVSISVPSGVLSRITPSKSMEAI
uniref:C2H2-type domain-containing protein n=1 Tax=Parascaris equorum TaxID=6256 RepID=A0A914RZK4_PAREQ